jgi:hypothetical protein
MISGEYDRRAVGPVHLELELGQSALGGLFQRSGELERGIGGRIAGRGFQAAAGCCLAASLHQREFFPSDLSAALLHDELRFQGVLGEKPACRGAEEQNRSEAHDNSDHVRTRRGSG